MTTNIEKGLFDVSYKLHLTTNKGIKGTTFHNTLEKARRTEITVYHQHIIEDLRNILIGVQGLDKTDVVMDDVIFFSRLEEFIRDSKDFGVGAFTHQLSYHVAPLLVKYVGKYAPIKVTLTDIATVYRKCTDLFGEYKINNPESDQEQINSMRTPLFTWE